MKSEMRIKQDYLFKDFDFGEISSDEFIDKFLELSNCKKQKKKEKSTLVKILKKLQNYDEPFAVNLMEVSILNDYQGVIFPNTDEQYSKYLKAKNRNSSQWQESGASNVSGKSSKQSSFFTGAEFSAEVQKRSEAERFEY